MIESLRRLIHYTALGMFTIPAVLMILAGMDYIGRHALHSPVGWMPMTLAMMIASVWVFHKTRNNVVN